MDAWWESLDQAYKAWTQAIDESDLTWKYRQVETGEWNLFDKEEEHDTDADTDTRMNLTPGAGTAGAGTGAPPLLDQPLPWDHLDTGIDKNWLKIDLQKALEAATVPDCSFEGCSRCGVCGTDFGRWAIWLWLVIWI